MSYTPTTWNTGDTITATAMNKIENGIASAGGALICTCSSNGVNYVLDKTVQEIYDAILGGTPVYIKYQYGEFNDYVGHLYLAPVVRIYNYNYTDTIRIVAVKPTMTSFSSYNYVATAGTVVYAASGLNEYPVFYMSVATNSNTTVQSVTASPL